MNKSQDFGKNAAFQIQIRKDGTFAWVRIKIRYGTSPSFFLNTKRTLFRWRSKPVTNLTFVKSNNAFDQIQIRILNLNDQELSDKPDPDQINTVVLNAKHWL
jgi:hypothetical protein